MSLMPYSDALAKLTQPVTKMQPIETVALLQARGRILAKDIVALQDSPVFDNSAMDGYAVCGLDRQTWQLVGYVAAGDSTAHIQLEQGQAVRIFTGSAVPRGSDAVIAQEDIQLTGQTIQTTIKTKAKQHVRFQAEEFAQGDILVAAGQVLSATQIGVAAAQGLASLACFASLKVTVFSSGNELQALGQPLQENQIYDSNRYMLSSLLAQHSYLNVVDGGALADDLAATEQALLQASQNSEVILISGGASVGDKDYTKQVLENLGQLEQWKLAIKPGKPFAWGQIGRCKVFVLPGNPVACWVTYLTLALPRIQILAGLSPNQAEPKTRSALAAFEIQRPQTRQQFLRANVQVNGEGQRVVSIHALQSSSMLANCGTSNALVVIATGETVAQGDIVQVIDLTLV